MAFLLKNKADKLSYQMRDGIGKDKKLKTYNSEIYTYYENEPIIDLSNSNYYDFIKVSSFEDAKDKLLSIGQSKISDGLGVVIDLFNAPIVESKKIDTPLTQEVSIAVVEEEVLVSSPSPQRHEEENTPVKHIKPKGRPAHKAKK